MRRCEEELHGSVNSGSSCEMTIFSTFRERSYRRFSSSTFSKVRAVAGSRGSTLSSCKPDSCRNAARVYLSVSTGQTAEFVDQVTLS
jgi:hypothetical protein